MSGVLKKNLLLLVIMGMLVFAIPAWATTCAQCDANQVACQNYAGGWLNGCMAACWAFGGDANTCFNYCVPTAAQMTTDCNNAYNSCYATCTP